ncbi:hypothetical protein B0J14DRAFT_641513 [Halenospora varia]|nr:hypothetical protein B0J14DRAFT_641513 [Halenospora varia]
MPLSTDEEANNGGQEMATRLVRGYLTLAKRLGSNPETAIFRSFEALNAQNLLYLQAKPQGLKKKLRVVESKTEADEQNKWRNIDWASLELSEKEGLVGNETSVARQGINPDDEAAGSPSDDDYQLRLVLEIRKTLKEYSRYDLKQLRRWMSLGTDGNYPLVGSDRDIWNTSDDLFALRVRVEADSVSVLITDYLMPLFHTLFVATLLSTIAIVTPVVVLYKRKAMPVRIGAMAAFTAGFHCVEYVDKHKE